MITSIISLAYAVASNRLAVVVISAIQEAHPDGVFVRTPDGGQQWLAYPFTLAQIELAATGAESVTDR
ncbi:MAG: hypothetical protein JXQ72_16525 [Anaerolineae bacterium]|nr:hypothetical protein [Anaerolineae bacterium]